MHTLRKVLVDIWLRRCVILTSSRVASIPLDHPWLGSYPAIRLIAMLLRLITGLGCLVWDVLMLEGS